MKDLAKASLIAAGLMGTIVLGSSDVNKIATPETRYDKNTVTSGDVVQIPDDLMQMKIELAREAWPERDNQEVIEVYADMYDGVEWHNDVRLFGADGGVRQAEKGGELAANSWEGNFPFRGKDRLLRVKVRAKEDLNSFVTVTTTRTSPISQLLSKLSTKHAEAVIAHVQSTTVVTCTASSCGAVFGTNVVAGNLLAFCWRYASGGLTITTTDTRSSTWVSNAVQAIDTGDGSSTNGISYSLSAGGSGADTVTASTGTSRTMRVSASEFNWNGSTGTFDKSATAIGTVTTNVTTSAVTPSADGSIFYACTHLSTTDTISAATDFTMGGNDGRLGTAYYVQTTAASHVFNFTITNTAITWGVVGVTFQPAGGGGGGTTVIPQEAIIYTEG